MDTIRDVFESSEDEVLKQLDGTPEQALAIEQMLLLYQKAIQEDNRDLCHVLKSSMVAKFAMFAVKKFKDPSKAIQTVLEQALCAYKNLSEHLEICQTRIRKLKDFLRENMPNYEEYHHEEYNKEHLNFGHLLKCLLYCKGCIYELELLIQDQGFDESILQWEERSRILNTEYSLFSCMDYNEYSNSRSQMTRSSRSQMTRASSMSQRSRSPSRTFA